MSKELTGLEATQLMRALSEEQREEAIYSSKNVIGYERFIQRSNQVARSESFRRPQ